ncbi:MAG: putative 3-oxoadipate enol-lactonase [Myxococcaceae bacterium]|nr:putative 3-oxoadipate enol-lactonase [Myxococcaceae bacterium]
MALHLPLCFVDEGEPEQLPVVFLHAFPYHSGMWAGQRSLLAGRARFLSLDARGLGPEAPPPRAYMLDHLVDDLFALLDQRGIASCVLCGLSMGGYVALRAIQREPARVRGLCLSNTQANSDSDEAKLARAQGLRVLARDGEAVFAQAQLQRQLSPHTLATRPELVHKLRQLIADSSVEGIAASLVALATRTDLRASLATIGVPTAIVVGAEDTITPADTARVMSESIAGAELHVIERAGHLASLEAEESFNQVLLSLIARVRQT